MKQNAILLPVLVAVLSTLLGCKKFVDVDPPKTELLISQAFSKDQAATSAVLGIYTNMQNDYAFINSGITIYGGLSADELIGFYPDPTSAQFLQNQLLPTNSTILSMWEGAYKNLAQVNTCIAGLEASTSLSASVKAQLVGEAKFCRAFTNFYLVNFWGNIPLVTSTDYVKNSVITQSPESETYDAIIADLKEAQLQLVQSYPTAGRVRPNKWAATALLARVYLYRKDYANAEMQSSSVIASGTYGPLPALNTAFLKESAEAIWQLLPTNNQSGTQEGYAFLSELQYGNPSYYLTDGLVNSFESGDNRKAEWIGTVAYEDQTYHYPLKYKEMPQYDPAVKESYVMLRLAEQYLIRAEARVQLNKVSDALADVNVIRARAGLGDLDTNDPATLLAAIANENRHEFFAEWGHRWLDLKRTGHANAVLSVAKPGWKPTAELFPIPQKERDFNKKLVQNSGY